MSRQPTPGKGMTKRARRMLAVGAAVLAIVAAGWLLRMEDRAMNEAYVIQLVTQFPGQKDWKAEIRAGDVILEKWSGFSRLPASMDHVQATRKEKVTNRPQQPQERLLRIRELGENGAVVAVLQQSIYYEGELRVIEEYERLRTVPFGEVFSVYVKQPVLDAPVQPMHHFVIYRKNQPPEPWPTAPRQPASVGVTGSVSTAPAATGAFSCSCPQCGHISRCEDTANPPRFCEECGARLSSSGS